MLVGFLLYNIVCVICVTYKLIKSPYFTRAFIFSPELCTFNFRRCSMIPVSIDIPVYTNGLKICPSHNMTCPDCKDGIAMWRYGYRLRKIRDFQGTVYWIGLQRYHCKNCNKTFVIFPSFLIPYKQYDRMTIQNIQNGFTNGCGASYLSIYLWKKILIA